MKPPTYDRSIERSHQEIDAAARFGISIAFEHPDDAGRSIPTAQSIANLESLIDANPGQVVLVVHETQWYDDTSRPEFVISSGVLGTGHTIERGRIAIEGEPNVINVSSAAYAFKSIDTKKKHRGRYLLLEPTSTNEVETEVDSEGFPRVIVGPDIADFLKSLPFSIGYNVLKAIVHSVQHTEGGNLLRVNPALMEVVSEDFARVADAQADMIVSALNDHVYDTRHAAALLDAATTSVHQALDGISGLGIVDQDYLTRESALRSSAIEQLRTLLCREVAIDEAYVNEVLRPLAVAWKNKQARLRVQH